MKRYRHLVGLLAVAVLLLGFVQIGVMHLGVALFLLGLYQVMQFAMSKPRAALYTSVLTPEQVREFSQIMDNFKGYDGMFRDLSDLAKMEGGFAAIKKLPELLKGEQKRNDDLASEVKKLQKQLLTSRKSSGVVWRRRDDGREEGFVSDDCARAISALFITTCAQQGRWPSAMQGEQVQQRMLAEACEVLGIQQRAASSLSGTEIPLPTIYTPQIVELVWKYGQIRQYGTVFPLGNGKVLLPRLKAGEDAFGYLGVGTAGMGQAVPKKQVAAENVEFNANKFGGLIAIPTELEEDTFIPLGQFLSRYIARRFAFGEDDTAFNGDGTAAYANIKGIAKYCVDNPTYLVRLGAGKTKPSDVTLADLRNMRPLVSAACYFESAYYMHPTMDALLVTFNTLNNPRIYERMPNGTATLDGFPIRWTGVHQPYGTAAAADKNMATFGALSYGYLGERGSPRVQTSLDVYFVTDEIAMRALERIDFQQMAIDALSTLKTAAA